MKAVKPWNTTTPFWPPQKVVEILELRGGFNFLKSIPCVEVQEHPIQGFKGSFDSSGKKHPLSESGQITSNYYTPPKTNMEPENEALEEEIPMKNHHF